MGMPDLKQKLDEIFAQTPAPAPVQPVVKPKTQTTSNDNLSGVLALLSIVALGAGIFYTYHLRQEKLVGNTAWQNQTISNEINRTIEPVQPPVQPPEDFTNIAALSRRIDMLNAQVKKNHAFATRTINRLGIANNENVYIDQMKKSPNEKLMFDQDFKFVKPPKYTTPNNKNQPD